MDGPGRNMHLKYSTKYDGLEIAHSMRPNLDSTMADWEVEMTKLLLWLS